MHVYAETLSMQHFNNRRDVNLTLLLITAIILLIQNNTEPVTLATEDCGHLCSNEINP